MLQSPFTLQYAILLKGSEPLYIVRAMHVLGHALLLRKKKTTKKNTKQQQTIKQAKTLKTLYIFRGMPALEHVLLLKGKEPLLVFLEHS